MDRYDITCPNCSDAEDPVLMRTRDDVVYGRFTRTTVCEECGYSE